MFTTQRHTNPEAGTATRQNKTLSYVVGGITVLVTIAAMWYFIREVNRVKPEAIHAQRKARSVTFFPCGAFFNLLP